MTTLFLAIALAAQTGVLAGVVQHEQGKPVSGVRVAVLSESVGTPPRQSLAAVTGTDSSGRYRVEGLPAGDYYVAAGLLSDPTYFPGTTDILEARKVTVGDRPAMADFTLTSWSACQLNVAGKRDSAIQVTGAIANQSGAAGIAAGAVVTVGRTVGGDPQSAVVGTDGTFQFALSPGEFRVSLVIAPLGFSLKSITSGSEDLNGGKLRVGPCAANSTTDVSLTITLNSDESRFSMGGRVLLRDGERTDNIHVELIDASGFMRRSFLQDNGFEFHGVIAGQYMLRLTRDGRELLTRPVVVEDRDVILTLSP